MPSSLAVELGLLLAILIAVAVVGLWIFRRGRVDQAEKDTRQRLKDSQEARDREHAIEEAVRKVRGQPGPALPDLDELQRGAGGKTPPAGT